MKPTAEDQNVGIIKFATDYKIKTLFQKEVLALKDAIFCHNYYQQEEIQRICINF